MRQSVDREMSNIHQFTIKEFERGLEGVLNGTPFSCLGMQKGELVYTVPVKDTNKRIVVRSSIDHTGMAAESGADSIRVWVEYWHEHGDRWDALGKDSKSWTTRLPGWPKRLRDRLRAAWAIAMADSKPKPQPQSDGESCPKCGSSMVLRTRKHDGKKFLGCSTYPRCKGGRNVDEPEQEQPATEVKKLTWSEKQKAIFEFVSGSNRHGVVQAVAGSGKTSTIVEALNHTDKDASVGFVAFNKRIAIELSRRAPDHVHVSTNHSLGFGNIRAAQGKTKVNNRKLYFLLRDIGKNLPTAENNTVKDNNRAIQRLVSLTKANMLEPTTESFEYITDRWNIDTNGEGELIYRIAAQLFKQSTADMGVIDFDDMIWFPASGKVPCKRFDILFIDEAQDLNKAQAALMMNSLNPDGRIIAVGDEFQCQPPGTMVMACAHGNRWFSETVPDLIPIEDVQVGEAIMTYDRRSASLVKTGIVTEKNHRRFCGQLYTVSAAGKSTRCTRNHKWLVRWNKNADDAHVVYLMRKDDKFRVGQTKMFRKGSSGRDFGLGMRARQERADYAWVLGIFDNVADATLYENLMSVKYGFSQVIFHEAANTVHMTQDKLDNFYNLVGNQVKVAAQCLSDHDLSIEYPLYINHKSGMRQRQSRTTLFETQTCNLIGGYMKVMVVPDGAINPANRTVTWEKVSVSTEYYNGLVHSLNVKKHHKYVADGLVTCNSIYGFAGADSDSIPNLIKSLDAETLPLSITYRCPKSHVKLAQSLVPQIEAAPWAKEGTLETVSQYQFAQGAKTGDMVLCRCNAPLVGPAFSLIRQGTKAVILGRDIGRSLMTLISKVQKKAKVHSLSDTLAALIEYGEREVSKLTRMKKHSRAQSIEDRVETIIALSDGCDTMVRLEEKIETIFSDEAEGVTFSSVHKAKGLEADTVWILRDDLMPHPKAEATWELQQEANIRYVAYTRSKSKLFFVDSE